MADLENRVDKLDERVVKVEVQVSETTANVNGLIRELKDFKDEIRQQNKMRADEIREIRVSLDGVGKHVRNLVWTSMAAIGGMVITVIYSMLKH